MQSKPPKPSDMQEKGIGKGMGIEDEEDRNCSLDCRAWKGRSNPLLLTSRASLRNPGVRRRQGWCYRLYVDDQTPEFIGEPSIKYSSNHVCSWRGALRLLDRYHWHRLYPLKVHPEFRQKIRAAFRRRVANDDASSVSAEWWRKF